MSDIPANASAISASLQMTKALALARQGRFKEAEMTVAPDQAPPLDLVLLHAQAALVTSSGDYARALQLWHFLLNRDPQHAEARRMITSIERWLSRPAWMRFIPLGAMLAAGLVLLLGLLWALSDSTPTPPSKKPVSPTPFHGPVTPGSPVRK